MAKYYVQCGEKTLVATANDPRAAGIAALARWCGPDRLTLLGCGVLVSEQGFGRGEAARLSTFELLAEIEGVLPEAILDEALAARRGDAILQELADEAAGLFSDFD